VTHRLVLFVLIAVTLLTLACGDGDSDGDGVPTPDAAATTTDGTAAAPTEPLAPTVPQSFEALRDELISELEAIGVNIGSVPPDVREHVLGLCFALEDYIDIDTVDELCGAIEDAMDSGDFGQIDLVIDELEALEPE
jgi:hypothetical protein